MGRACPTQNRCPNKESPCSKCQQRQGWETLGQSREARFTNRSQEQMVTRSLECLLYAGDRLFCLALRSWNRINGPDSDCSTVQLTHPGSLGLDPKICIFYKLQVVLWVHSNLDWLWAVWSQLKTKDLMGYGRAGQRCLLGRTRTGPSGQTYLRLKEPRGDDQLNRYSSPSIFPLNHCTPIMSASLLFLEYSRLLPSESLCTCCPPAWRNLLPIPTKLLPSFVSSLFKCHFINVFKYPNNTVNHHLLSCSIFLTALNTPKCG